MRRAWMVMAALLGLGWFGAAEARVDEVDPEEVRSVWEYLAGRYDRNEDGKISEKEYTRSAEHFARLDRDGNGVIEKADVEQAARRRNKRGARERVEAPREGEVAPDFELEVLGRAENDEKKTKKKAAKAEVVRLSKLKGKRLVALIFGSYT